MREPGPQCRFALDPALAYNRYLRWHCECTQVSGLSFDEAGARLQFDLHLQGLWPTVPIEGERLSLRTLDNRVVRDAVS